jgi:hypothetical protein
VGIHVARVKNALLLQHGALFDFDTNSMRLEQEGGFYGVS